MAGIIAIQGDFKESEAPDNSNRAALFYVCIGAG
jgi:hypothetical protein